METGHDTIAAISTPRGSGGIAVIRISGPGALEAISRCFRTARKDFPAGARDFSLGRVFLPSGGFVDEAVCIVMRGPRSYTGEDVAELQCHGGTAAARSVLSAALQSGCRQARAGEFTRRAFMNGKISLLKAESVLAMIKARTEAARQVASSMLSGRAEGQAVRAKELVSGILARMEAQLDWPDEMKDEGSWDTAGEIDEAAARIGGMIDEAGKGRLLTEGIKVAIIGRPNMGKSSLLNRLLGMDRAIVSELPGTTRDTVEETANVEGIPIRFADTAGIGAFEDPVVAAGVARAKQAASSSSVIVYVCAFPDGLSDEDVEELGRIKGKSVIVAFNKEDLQDEGGSQLASLPRRGFDPMGYRSVRVSAKTGRGMEDLRAAIANEACNITDFEGAEGPYARWLSCLEGCRERLSSAGRALSSGMPTEAVCLDLREALCSLGEFTGDTTADDVVGMVFDKFCIGK